MRKGRMNYRERRKMEDDIRCHNQLKADIRFQDGALPHVKGACNYQVVRAARNPQISPEGRGFTYNHAGMLTWYQGSFLCEYLSGPRGEHEVPSAVFVCRSEDGIHWQKPQEAFPPIEVDSRPYRGPKKELIASERIACIAHHRMGFYTSSTNRLLMMTFYGISPDFHMIPNNGYGVGRAVREIYPDFSMSEIYFLRYNLPGGYNQENTKVFPYFEESEDEGFRNACRELLADRLVTQQWWEEERLDTAFFTRPDGKALSYYTLPNGRVMGVFKNSLTSYTDDGGESWSPIKKSVSIETSTGKVWGQKTADNRYALVFNPVPDGAHRWPLAMMTGENGVDFDHLMTIHPEISPCRYEGKLKNLGAQYVRGITEANSHPQDQAMWLVYSVNKEDIWVARVPVPAVSVEKQDVKERMADLMENDVRERWNLYVPSWNRAELMMDEENETGLLLTDCDPYDRTRAMRLFRSGSKVELETRLKVKNLSQSPFSLFLQDRKGQIAVCVLLRPDGWVCMHHGGLDTPLCRYSRNKEVRIRILADCVENCVKLSVFCNGEEKTVTGATAASVDEMERVVFATKYSLPWQGLEVNGKLGTIGDLPDADKRQEETAVSILELTVTTLEE